MTRRLAVPLVLALGALAAVALHSRAAFAQVVRDSAAGVVIPVRLVGSDAAPPAPRLAPPRARPAPPPPVARAAVAAPARFVTRALGAPKLPVGASSATTAVLHVQSLLDGAGFAPGALDGRWRASTRRAVRAFREARGLAAGETVDEATYAALQGAANVRGVVDGAERPTVVEVTLGAADVRGRFRPLPASLLDRAALDCQCYTSLGERLAERFHTTRAMLRALNPELVLDSLKAGTTLWVPNPVRLPPARVPARLVVDKEGRTLRGLDSAGGVVFALPASVGSDSNPSPTGRLRVLSVTRNPWYAYDLAVLTSGRSRGRTADLPPGPNSPVGVVWIQLSRSHVGIHGTPEPEGVGTAPSHGCVRLTNWDARYVAGLVRAGMEVELQ